MKSKPFDQVQIGDQAVFSFDPENKWDIMGKIIWKGSYKELMENEKLKHHVNVLDEDESDLLEVDWVIIDDGTETILYNYNCDPCGVMVIELTL